MYPKTISTRLTVLFFMAMSGMAPAAETVDWPMWGYDAARSGRSPMELPASLQLHWRRELPAPLRAWPKQLDDGDKLEFDLSYSPIVMGDLLFVPSMVTDSLTAYRVEDGVEVWRFYADGPMRLAPAAWNGRVYAISDDGHLYCLDAADGTLHWRFNAAPSGHRVLGNERVVSMWPARGAPVVKDGQVYFAAGIWPFLGTFVYALDAASGAVVWANTGHATEWQGQPHGGAYAFAGLAPQGYLAAAGDRLVVSGGRALPGIFDRRDGSLLHSLVTGKEVGGYRVRIDDDHYYNHGRRYRLSDGGGAGEGLLENESLQIAVTSVADQLDSEPFEALAARDRLFVVTRKGTLYAFGAETREALRHAHRPAAPTPGTDAAGSRAAAILEQSGATAGYALFMGVGDGDLIEQIALRSELHLVGIDPDQAKIDALRRRFDAAGLYGTRIALLPGHPADSMYPRYISSLIVMDAGAVLGREADAALLAGIYSLLRPYDGMAVILTAEGNRTAFETALAGFTPENGSATMTGDSLVLAREGPLPDTGQWTHQYADAANTTHSADDRVRPPFGPIWFGGPNHDNILPRHSQGPVPQVAGGRMILPGVETLSARCVFTGRELWLREFPGVGHPFTNLELEAKWRDGESVYMTNLPGANFVGSPFVSLPDAIYLRYRGQVLRLDPETGATLAVFDLDSRDPDGFSGGHISVSGDVLLVTADPQMFDDGPIGDQNVNALSSDRLLALNRHHGERLWSRDADIGFRHNAIISGGERVFLIDSLNEPAMELLERRGRRPQVDPVLWALELETGKEVWNVSDGIFGTWLGYSAAHDVLVQGGRGGGKRAVPGEAYERTSAYRGSDGALLWQNDRDTAHLALAGDWLIPGHPLYGWALDLRTGEPISVPHPLTGEPIEWRYWRTYGCNTFNTSTHLLLFRTGSAGYADLTGHGGTGTLGGFKAGCSNNMIPADGVLSVPDYTRTCTCSYQNQTSLGLIHMPEMEMWSANQTPDGVPRWGLEAPTGTIARVGINFGAPGGRQAANGTLWTPFPATDAPAPELRARLNTLDHADTPVRIIMVSGSSAGAEDTLDGEPSSAWGIRSNRQGRFDAWLQYDLNTVATLDQVAMTWSGPAATQFRIEVSEDGLQWTTVSESAGSGEGRDDPVVYRFDPVRARHVRLVFDAHGRQRRDRLSVFEARLGGLADPAAYAYFRSVNGFYRQHALQVEGRNGLNWVAASGVEGIRYFELDNLAAGGAPYHVTLHFAEPKGLAAGQRVFAIFIQGEAVETAFDIVHAAEGRNRAVTRSFADIRVDGNLRIGFESIPGSAYPPLLAGVEIVRNGTP